MRVTVTFYSYFKDLTGCARTLETVPEAATLGELVQQLTVRFPRLQPMHRAMLLAVGVDYQDRRYVLREGDEVALFPPVQGG